MSNLKYVMGPMRPPFLILTPACVLLGLGTAIWSQGSVSVLHFVLALVGAIASHISVNAFNEYFDFKSGLDLKTERTPFSGGSGTLPEKPEMLRATLTTAIVTLAIVCGVGLYFLSVWGPAILPLGLAGVLIVVIYSPLITHNAFLSLIAPGVGFGSLMVVGTHFVLTGQYSSTAFVASLVPFFLVNNLLLLNQFPDMEADRSVGRRNYVILLGRRGAAVIYVVFHALAFVSIVAGVTLGYLPNASLMGLVAIALAIPTAIGAYRHADDIKRLMPIMGLNVILNIVTPLLVAVGLFLG